MESEKRFGILKKYEKLNLLTFAGALGVAMLYPPLASVAVGIAAVDFAQMPIIENLNRKSQNS